MKKIFLPIVLLTCFVGLVQAQNDSMYIMKQGLVLSKYKVAEVDSVIFHKPVVTKPNSTTVQIPAGTFTMGSPTNEVGRSDREVQHKVTLSAFKMSKYAVTNEEFAAFLNTKGIGSNGLFAAGTYPTEKLIKASILDKDNRDNGLHFTNSKWVPVAGFEKHPIAYVTWYGAFEYAKSVGGRLPTEAEREYACRANTTTAFSTGACLSSTQANFNWTASDNICASANTTFPDNTVAVGSYPANAWGLYDLHGNIWEWCNDWESGAYSAADQTNPTGPATGEYHILRGGAFAGNNRDCRSAAQNWSNDTWADASFRVVFP